MWVEDTLKALYFLSHTRILIDKIENNFVYTTNGKKYPFVSLIDNYYLILKGEEPEFFPELYDIK